jgi:hypothetical protein
MQGGSPLRWAMLFKQAGFATLFNSEQGTARSTYSSAPNVNAIRFRAAGYAPICNSK